ncbi:unnamed protein product [Angiostrongylus costaricensis]|uniref:Ribosomal protein L32 n=1 Tax=Angiostrongylus costaricensis TaxID=334426 RepID=A0A0R3PLD9_ANGCS|nr:unnamed protein product [Angiostrongylus costaricensis]
MSSSLLWSSRKNIQVKQPYQYTFKLRMISWKKKKLENYKRWMQSVLCKYDMIMFKPSFQRPYQKRWANQVRFGKRANNWASSVRFGR